jgi:hypothetical protein
LAGVRDNDIMTSGTQPTSQNGTTNSNGNGSGTTPRTKICVYCGASSGTTPAHLEAARELGRVMAENNIDLGESFGHSPMGQKEGTGRRGEATEGKPSAKNLVLHTAGRGVIAGVEGLPLQMLAPEEKVPKLEGGKSRANGH